jgi:serine protease Do
VLADIREYGHVRRPKLGVRVQPVTALDAEVFGLDRVTGAKVFSVDQGTPAQRAGVRAGDVIVTLDGKEIPTSNALTTSLAQHHPGERVTLGIVRDKRRTELAVTLGEFEQATASAERRDGAGRGAREERLGFSVQPLTPQLASQFELTETSGVVVVDVRNFSPAAAAAVRPGLLIRSINGDEVSTPQDVARIAGDISAGDAVSIRGVYAGIGEVVINFRAR